MELSPRTKAAANLVTLSWTNIDYNVRTKTQGDLQILKSVSGYAKAGRLLAIMGASGSGKTTLLDVLCSRANEGTVEGEILVNGLPKKKSNRFAYVPQHDQLLNSATVRETLETAAYLRVPNITKDEVNASIESVLGVLSMKHREDALVGGGEIRGLSGGERRRVSIGQELVSNINPIVFLDEPTTGLDSHTAESVMSCLVDLAKIKNAAVIATIHQPNSTITAMFDDFMLMAKGQCCYFGPYSTAVERFGAIGFKCPLYSNPTDYFLSLIVSTENIETLANAQSEWLASQLEDSTSEASEAFRKSPLSPRSKNAPELPVESNSRYPTSIFKQTIVLTVRAARQWWRDPGMFASELIQYIFIALFIGGMYFNVSNDLEAGVFNRVSSLFFVLAVLVFTPPFTAVTTFSLERHLFVKERKDKVYRASSWLLAKSFVTYPIEGLFCIVFSCITYFMIGYQNSAEKFFIFFGVLLLFQLNAESMGLLFAIITDSPVYAIVWLSLVLIVALSLAGFLTYSMPIYYKWIMDANILHFTLSALISNEFDGLVFESDAGPVNGLDALPPLLKPKFSIGENVGLLIATLIGQRLLILICLIMQNKHDPFNWLLRKLTCGFVSSDTNYSAVAEQDGTSDPNVV